MLTNLPAMLETSCNEGDRGLISGWGRSPKEGNGNPLQYPCLGNPMDRGVARVGHDLAANQHQTACT